jgi:hypothetical protein
MQISRPMQQIEKLLGLRHRAKKVVITPGAIFVFIEPHRRALDVNRGRLNRTIFQLPT